LAALLSGIDIRPEILVALLQRVQQLVFRDGFGGRLERQLRVPPDARTRSAGTMAAAERPQV